MVLARVYTSAGGMYVPLGSYRRESRSVQAGAGGGEGAAGTPGGTGERPDGAAPERSDKPKAGAVKHRGKDGVPAGGENEGHAGAARVLSDQGSCFHHLVCYLVWILFDLVLIFFDLT